jgi:hypothetical protein
MRAEAVGFNRPCAAHLARPARRSRKTLVDPGLDLAGRGGPAQRIGHLCLDLADAFGAVLQQAFEPFRVQAAGAGFQRHLILQRADLARTACLVADIDRRLLPAGARFTAREMPPSVSK